MLSVFSGKGFWDLCIVQEQYEECDSAIIKRQIFSKILTNNTPWLTIITRYGVSEVCEFKLYLYSASVITVMYWSYYIKLCYNGTRLYKNDKISMVNQLTHWGRDNMAVISQTTLSNAFSWMKMLECRLRFHWSLFLRVKLTIIQHWFR